jgi:hypothetical protein
MINGNIDNLDILRCASATKKKSIQEVSPLPLAGAVSF